MTTIKIGNVICKISVHSKKQGKKILLPSLLNAELIKQKLDCSVKKIPLLGEIRCDKLVVNLGVIPAKDFETLFGERLIHAFSEKLISMLTSGKHQPLSINEGETNAEAMTQGNHSQSNPLNLYKQAVRCLQPASLQGLMRDNTVQQLQQMHRQLLRQALSQPLPERYYQRVTAARLSASALLYLTQDTQGIEWLEKHFPETGPLNEWVLAIVSREIPTELVVQLLTDSSSVSPLLARRWLLPLWQRKSIRETVRKSEGRECEANISACLNYLLLKVNEKTEDAISAQHSPLANLSALGDEKTEDVVSAQRSPLANSSTLRDENTEDVVSAQCSPLANSSALRDEKKEGTVPAQRSSLANSSTLRDEKTEDTISAQHSTLANSSTNRDKNTKPHILSSRLLLTLQDVPVSNAGLVLLWPLLPQLFTQLALCDEQRFISIEARRQAMRCLSWLVWGDAPHFSKQQTLEWLICGEGTDSLGFTQEPLHEELQQQLDNWLSAIGKQLPSWEKLSLTDIRQLFLQRPGTITTGDALTQITVKNEPYDFLLSNWPWPLSLISLPWLEQPLAIAWPINGITG